MPSTRIYNRSFAGGEISPEMYGRIDDAKFQTGAAKLRNFIASPTGAATNRPGFAFVKATKNNGVARLIPFTYSLGQTMAIELGAGYARFHSQGATLQYSDVQPAFVASVAAAYTVANPSVLTAVSHGFLQGQEVVLAMQGGPIIGDPYPAGLAYGPYYVNVLDANTFNLLDPTTLNPVAVTAAGTGTLVVQPNYATADLVSFGGAFYYRIAPPLAYLRTGLNPIDADPATDGYWYALPADLTYEIPTPYEAADLFSIHFAQSADVMTLVHPNYPPQELPRESATTWIMAAIAFGPPLATPTGIAVAASPGFKAQIGSVANGSGAQAGDALLTTVSNHTLALGDPIYIANFTFTPTGGLRRCSTGSTWSPTFLSTAAAT